MSTVESRRLSLTLIITTYERPDALAAVLGTVGQQTDAPDEVVIADDGSGNLLPMPACPCITFVKSTTASVRVGRGIWGLQRRAANTSCL
jgi:hypothetical protein